MCLSLPTRGLKIPEQRRGFLTPGMPVLVVVLPSPLLIAEELCEGAFLSFLYLRVCTDLTLLCLGVLALCIILHAVCSSPLRRALRFIPTNATFRLQRLRRCCQDHLAPASAYLLASNKLLEVVLTTRGPKRVLRMKFWRTLKRLSVRSTLISSERSSSRRHH
jgi:hypothetical protein